MARDPHVADSKPVWILPLLYPILICSLPFESKTAFHYVSSSSRTDWRHTPPKTQKPVFIWKSKCSFQATPLYYTLVHSVLEEEVIVTRAVPLDRHGLQLLQTVQCLPQAHVPAATSHLIQSICGPFQEQATGVGSTGDPQPACISRPSSLISCLKKCEEVMLQGSSAMDQASSSHYTRPAVMDCTLNHVSKYSFHSLGCFCLAFCHSNGKYNMPVLLCDLFHRILLFLVHISLHYPQQVFQFLPLHMSPVKF